MCFVMDPLSVVSRAHSPHEMNMIQIDERVMANFSPGDDPIPGGSSLLPAQR